jgi:hypothetical protein
MVSNSARVENQKSEDEGVKQDPPGFSRQASRATDDGRIDSLNAPRRIVSLQNVEREDDPLKIDDARQDPNNCRRTSSYYNNLPVADAEPEPVRVETVVSVAAEVVAVDAHDVDSDTDEDDSLRGTRPSLISVRIFKNTRETKLGISFISVAGEVQICKIASTGPLARSPLRPGDRLVSLDNNRSCTNWTAAQAANHVKEKVGLLSIVVKNPNGNPNAAEATVYKTSSEDRIGISFKEENGRLRIGKIKDSGLLGDMSVLHAGDYVESINQISCSYVGSCLAVEMVRNAEKLVTILVKNSDATELSIRDMQALFTYSRLSTNDIQATADEVMDLEAGILSETQFLPCLISVKVSKPTAGTKLGINFINPEEGVLQISSITKGLLGKSPLKSGFIVMSIDYKPCRDWSRQYALDYLRGKVGDVLIVAKNPNGNPSYVHTMADKPSARAKLGVTFKKSSQGPLKIGMVRPDGIFANSVLNAEDDVIAINNIPCQHMTSFEALGITQRIADSVTILSKTGQSTGVVVSHQPRSQGRVDHARIEANELAEEKCPCWLYICLFAVAAIIITSSLAVSQQDVDDDYYDDYNN